MVMHAVASRRRGPARARGTAVRGVARGQQCVRERGQAWAIRYDRHGATLTLLVDVRTCWADQALLLHGVA
jgi:hypothetical protein